MEGLSALLETVEQIREAVNPGLEIEGLLRTMFDARNNLANQVSEQLLEHFGDKVYRTIIPRNIRLAEAPSYGTPVLKYDQASRGAIAYLALAGELVRREQERQAELEQDNDTGQEPPRPDVDAAENAEPHLSENAD